MKKILYSLLFLFHVLSLNAQNQINHYKVCFGEGQLNDTSYIVIRQYENNGKAFYMAVNPDSIETRIIPASQFKLKPISWSQILVDYKNTAYIKAIQKAQSQSMSIQNSGITHGFPTEKGITLTIDLCPSKKPLDRIIFTSLITEFQKTEKPVPMAISLTGRFMLSHKKDINWLKSLVDSGEISVTWVNHTYNHFYNPKLPLNNNFLLAVNTNLNFEILQTEIAMLQNGLRPSTFFRFPGLVSDQQVVDSVLNYGIIPIGSDAWLAKGQKAYSGSIVLIHGNGNEPMGVKDFIRLLQNEKASVLNKQWLLYDLRESVAEEVKN
jgi:hypothetical protein